MLIKDSDGTPLSRVSVSSLPQPNWQIHLRGFTVVDGSVTFKKIPDSFYSIQIDKSGYTSVIWKGKIEAKARVVTIIMRVLDASNHG
jgi:hypothetical protein